MEIFRLHITRIYGLILILAGIGLSSINISKQKVNHEAFTSWLETHLKNDESEAQKKLDHLSKHPSDAEEIIRKASEVVVSHSDDFKFPVHEDEKSNRELVFHLLLTQWTQIQHTEAGMSKAVFLEIAKPYSMLPNDGKFNNLDALSAKKPIPNLFKSHYSNSLVSPSSSHLLSPLKSVTAIGAP